MHSKSLAIIGWEEGVAGQIDSWIGSLGYEVKMFIHPNEKLPEIKKIKRHTKNFDYPENLSFKGKKLLITKDWCEVIIRNSIHNCIIAISDHEERQSQIKYAKGNKINLINAIHPSVIINKEVKFGKNIIIMSGAIIGYRVEIQDGVLINTGVQVDHHCLLEKNTTLNPGCVLAGNVLVEEKAIIHTNATVINKIIIGNSSVVGAGSVVIRNVTDNSVVVGVPAKPNFKSLV